ncbi:zinc finger and BTB domain-containing protein 41-like [Planococcus citri]|uniref:zinc finger and BTB domain-containing protein 41-like n=1 Tax=Planococcus citri TaxID=170843 RepID=UPI0031F8CD35
MSPNLCNDWVKRCDSLFKKNSAKFYKCAELQETLRVKFIETNTEYKFLKTWLHTAFEDTITLKREHGDLSRLYQVLLKNNLIKELIDYFTNKEMVQLKYIETQNQCMNLRNSLGITNKDIVSLTSEHEELTRRYSAILQNVFVDKVLDVYAHQQEALQLKFVETVDKCESLYTSLNEAYEATMLLISEHDEIVKRYQELSAINIVKEFLEYSKYRETNRSQFVEKSVQCRLSESYLDQAETEAREMLNTERLEREQVESERDSLVYLSDELCRVLLDYQRRTLPNDSDEKYNKVRESIEHSINYDAESDTESKDGILDINDQISCLNEASNESIDVKSEPPEVATVFLEVPTNETLELSSSHFDCDNSFVENSDVSALTSEPDRKYNSFVQTEIPNTRKLYGEIHQLHPTIKISNLTGALTQSLSKSVLYDKPSPKIINPIGNAHDLVETESLLCDKCGQSFDTKKHKQCPICNIVRPNKRGRKPKIFSTDSNINMIDGSDSRCDICLRNYSSKNSLKKHIRAIHDGQKPYKCPECDKSFSAKCNLKTHVIIHSSEKPFQCSSCDECFRDPSSKRRHELSHGEARFFCAVCDQRFFRKDQVLRHIRKEHLSIHRNSNKKFKCTICAKLLASKQILNRHYCRVHKFEASRLIISRSTDFHCAHCEKRYVKKNHLAKHLQKHGFVIDLSSLDEYDEEVLQMKFIEVQNDYESSKKAPI